MMGMKGSLQKLKMTAMSYNPLARVCKFFSKACPVADAVNDTTSKTSIDTRRNQAGSFSSKMHLSPLLSNAITRSSGFDVEVVDDDTWLVSSGLAHGWQGLSQQMNFKVASEMSRERTDGVVSSGDDDDPDFVEMDDMRVRGDLFYKLDRDSKEFEEYSFDFHRKKSSKRNPDSLVNVKDSMNGNNRKECKREENAGRNSLLGVEKPLQIMKAGRAYSVLDNMDGSICAEKKKARTPTFNQLTAPYHEPFCLDIYISKASVRACIIHRVTSKVVAVAHSISKDMKFDLSSTRNSTACAAVGKILAQRALADDIHDVVYTPRKGEKLEGKLQIVLQSILDYGINVKVKLKQTKTKKPQRGRAVHLQELS